MSRLISTSAGKVTLSLRMLGYFMPVLVESIGFEEGIYPVLLCCCGPVVRSLEGLMSDSSVNETFVLAAITIVDETVSGF